VDLVARTASFEGPLAKAGDTGKRSAKDIQNSFNKMDFGEARGGLMLIDELIGVHIPRHATAFASQIPGLMQALSLAMPLAAIAAVAKGIFDAVEKAKKKQEELRDHTIEAGTAISSAFNSLDQKLLQAGISADVLSHKHLAELKKRLELINLQSMAELAHSFDVISKAADKVFADLTSHWYSFGIGSDGARNALTTFKTQYDALLAQGKGAEAADLLAGTLKSAEKILVYQKEYKRLNEAVNEEGTGKDEDYYKFHEAGLALTKAGVTATENEVKSQQALVDTLKAQVVVQGKVAALQGYEVTAANQKDVGEYNEAQIKKMIILKNAINASVSLSEKRTEEDIKAIEKENTATIKAIDEQLALYQRIDNAKLKIATVTREISDQEAIQTQKMNVATGHMTEQQAVQQALKALEKNKKDELDEVNQQLEKQLAITQQLRAATNGGNTGTNDQKAQYLKAVAEYQTMEENKLQITKKFNAQLNAENLKAANNEQSQWRKMALDFGQIQTHMSQLARQTLGQMNSSIAAFVVTGTGNFRQLAVSAIEGFIEMALQYVESKTIMLAIDLLFGKDRDKDREKTMAGNVSLAASGAALAAAQTLALTAGIFLPPVPESLAAMAYGVGMAFSGLAMAERGAILPNRQMLVNTHPEEMILPQHISNFVVNAASRASSGSGGGHTFHVNPVFAPTIQAIDQKGVREMLKTYHDEFQAHLMDELRRMNY
jgi:lambda family phage tail tape measure protein